MRLGIDLDGVVANFTGGWMSFYNRQFGTRLVFEDATRWTDLVDLTHFRDIDDFWDWSSDLGGRSIFWHLDPFPGAVAALRDLAAQGHELVVLTHKPAFAEADTHDWIARQGIPATEVHILAEKWEVDCHAYLDDGPHILPDLVANRSDRLVCRYVRAWNRPVEGAVDVRDFEEYKALIAAGRRSPG